jgi:hypothetical protein
MFSILFTQKKIVHYRNLMFKFGMYKYDRNTLVTCECLPAGTPELKLTSCHQTTPVTIVDLYNSNSFFIYRKSTKDYFKHTVSNPKYLSQLTPADMIVKVCAGTIPSF